MRTTLINPQNESLDLRIRTQPKHPGIVSLRGPIVVRRPLKKPAIAPDMYMLVTRAAVALGDLLSPFAALLPTLELGLGKDNFCGAPVTRRCGFYAVLGLACYAPQIVRAYDSVDDLMSVRSKRFMPPDCESTNSRCAEKHERAGFRYAV